MPLYVSTVQVGLIAISTIVAVLPNELVIDRVLPLSTSVAVCWSCRNRTHVSASNALMAAMNACLAFHWSEFTVLERSQKLWPPLDGTVSSNLYEITPPHAKPFWNGVDADAAAEAATSSATSDSASALAAALVSDVDSSARRVPREGGLRTGGGIRPEEPMGRPTTGGPFDTSRGGDRCDSCCGAWLLMLLLLLRLVLLIGTCCALTLDCAPPA